MTATVRIRRNADGVVREYVDPEGWWDPGDDGFGGAFSMWSEGNWSCDCNRALFFARAADEDEEALWDAGCPGTSTAFTVLSITVDGRVVYSEET